MPASLLIVMLHLGHRARDTALPHTTVFMLSIVSHHSDGNVQRTEERSSHPGRSSVDRASSKRLPPSDEIPHPVDTVSEAIVAREDRQSTSTYRPTEALGHRGTFELGEKGLAAFLTSTAHLHADAAVLVLVRMLLTLFRAFTDCFCHGLDLTADEATVCLRLAGQDAPRRLTNVCTVLI